MGYKWNIFSKCMSSRENYAFIDLIFVVVVAFTYYVFSNGS